MVRCEDVWMRSDAVCLERIMVTFWARTENYRVAKAAAKREPHLKIRSFGPRKGCLCLSRAVATRSIAVASRGCGTIKAIIVVRPIICSSSDNTHVLVTPDKAVPVGMGGTSGCLSMEVCCYLWYMPSIVGLRLISNGVPRMKRIVDKV
jgi:hypothetical protein